jgi:hypothetical protein
MVPLCKVLYLIYYSRFISFLTHMLSLEFDMCFTLQFSRKDSRFCWRSQGLTRFLLRDRVSELPVCVRPSVRPLIHLQRSVSIVMQQSRNWALVALFLPQSSKTPLIRRRSVYSSV